MGSEASLVSLLLMSYGAIAQFFPLMIAAMFWRRASREGAIYGLLARLRGDPGAQRLA